jgi:hypothetical protein
MDINENDWEKYITNKIDNNEELTERELRNLATLYEVDREEGNDGRWYRPITSYVALWDGNYGRYFKIDWSQGLTECQDNCFDNQPIEVKKVSHEEIIPEHKVTVAKWEEIN